MAITKLRITYLFGAGATHAELANASWPKMQDATFQERNSLLLADVSRRVCLLARSDPEFPEEIGKLISVSGLSNLELFISLLEKNQVESNATGVRLLKQYLTHDIVSRVSRYKRRFCLHKALLEFHKLSEAEELTGLISLNYDRVLDEAYQAVNARDPHYCLSATRDDAVPLLKLHGGFGLTYRDAVLPIITPGVTKNYLELPYNFLWGRALEILLDCDVLRVIGCSLNQNDIGIVDLLFKPHLKRQRKPPFLVQIIDFDPQNNRIKDQFGFFPQLERATEIEGQLIADNSIRDPTKGSNPFKIWLKAKIARALQASAIKRSTYIKLLSGPEGV